MSMFGEGERWRNMFQDSNRIRFERPVNEISQDWWNMTFYEPYGLSPEGMGDLLTASMGDEKAIIYRHIDGVDHSFSLRVEGGFHAGGMLWFVERSLTLDSKTFNADVMFVPVPHNRGGRGRGLMKDLMVASELLQLNRICVEAERIGRYAWLRMGFVPDTGSWRDMRIDLIRFIAQNKADLKERANELTSMVLSGSPKTARWLANCDYPVESRELFDDSGNPLKTPFGKTFFLEASPKWTGEFTFDKESKDIANEYVRS